MTSQVTRRLPTNGLAPWSEKVPPEWELERMGNVAEIMFSNVDKHTLEDEIPVSLCNYVDVYKNDRITSAIDFMRASAEQREIDRFQIRAGDVLATKDSETPDDIAISAVVAEEMPNVLCGYHLAMIRPHEHRAHGPFLSWLHCCKAFRAHYEANAVGVTRFGLSQSKFKEVRVPLPAVSEQKLIAEFLDTSCAAIDAAMGAKRRQLKTLDSLRISIITRAVTRGLSSNPVLEETGNAWMAEIPKNWELIALKRICKIQTGLTLGKTYDGPLAEHPYLRVANVHDGHIDLSDVTQIEVPESVAHRVQLAPNDVLMTEGGDLDKLGRGTIWQGQISDCLHQNHIFAIRCFPHKLKPEFLAHLTASQYGRDYFEATGKRTTNLASTSSKKVGLLPIPLPSINEQDVICTYLARKLGELKQLSGDIKSQISVLTAYRKSLIHECVTGQRRITEADLRRAGLPNNARMPVGSS